MKKFIMVIAITFAILAGLATSVVPSLAQGVNPCDISTGGATKPGCDSPLLRIFGIDQVATGGFTSNSIASFIATVAAAFIVILASLSVIYLIFNSYKMMSDAGDGKKFGDGLKGVKFAIGGLFVALLSFGIVSLIVRIVG